MNTLVIMRSSYGGYSIEWLENTSIATFSNLVAACEAINVQ